MNLITNYYELSLEHWEGLARTACFEVNQEVRPCELRPNRQPNAFSTGWQKHPMPISSCRSSTPDLKL